MVESFTILLVIISSFNIFVMAAPASETFNLDETLSLGKETKKWKESLDFNHKPVLLHSGRQRGTRLGAPPKDTYGLLVNLKKVQGSDGRSPVCKICSGNSVDENTV